MARLLSSLAMAALLAPVLVSADPAAVLKKNSPFTNFSLNQVEDGQVLESRQGASLSAQIEAGQTCFLVKAPPDAVAQRIMNFDPAGKPGLDVSKHETLSSSVSADTFQGALDKIFKSSGGDGSWIAQQSKNAKDSSCELLLTAGEKDKLAAASSPGKLASAWANLLANRFAGFRDHGAPDFQNLRSVIGKLLGTSISGPSGDAKYYWEIGDVSDRGTMSEGVSWSDSSGGATRVFDGEFFVTSEYTASFNVSTLWPVTIKGKTETLVWRIDSAFAPQFTDQSGAERIASTGMILSSTKKTIEALRKDGK